MKKSITAVPGNHSSADKIMSDHYHVVLHYHNAI